MDSVINDDTTSLITPIESASREFLKGTLVSIKATPLKGTVVGLRPEPLQEVGHGLAKYALVRQLAITSDEVDSIRGRLKTESKIATDNANKTRVSESTLNLIRSFKDSVLPVLQPNIAAIASVPNDELMAFANALVQDRTLKVQAAQQNHSTIEKVGNEMQLLNSAAVAVRGFEINTAAQPYGMLNLERLEMTPIGIQRGELIATIPLAPGEETAVTHKEWSVTSKEFTTIVSDSLEEVSETGVTENTDLSQSTTSQTQHSNQFNITGTVQGGIPLISGSSTVGVTAQGADSYSALESIKHASSITHKAASRSRQEHKTTISATTVTGMSETSTRILKNNSITDPIRIDYFSLMRKWQVRLYRFGLRLTYDLVVPEPGAAMRRAYMELDKLRKQLGPFVFNVKYSDIQPDIVDKNGNSPATGVFAQPKYLWLADRYGVVVKLYPTEPAPLFKSVRGAGNRDWSYLDLEFDVPPSAKIKELYLSAKIGNSTDGDHPTLQVIGAKEDPSLVDAPDMSITDVKILAIDGTPFMQGATGKQMLTFFLDDSNVPALNLKVILENSINTIEQWRKDVWQELYNAAQNKYYSQQQDIAARIRDIEDKLENVDTLTLRREESEEIMKSVLKFVLGTEFDFMPPDVEAVFKVKETDLKYGIAFDGQSLNGLGVNQWSLLQQHQDIVRFLNQAIEWENVVTFLYSYFWDVPQSWEFIRAIRHPDANRQAFLRAGSARVVLTVRKGWEEKWMYFTQTGKIKTDTEQTFTGPYLSIAQEIAAYDNRNYPGIPPANPARTAIHLQDAVYSTSVSKIDVSKNPVSIEVGSSEGFVLGQRVVLDVEDDRHIQEAVIVLEKPDKTHIIVAEVNHQHDGSQIPFPVLQPGEKGALIAEWYEYTPSSGTDIAISSNLTTIA